MNSGTLRHWWSKVIFGALTVAAVVFFVVAFLDVQREDGLHWPKDVAWGWVALSLAIGVAHVAAMGAAFAWLLELPTAGRVSAVYMFSQVAKYVPGRIWGVVAQHSLMGEKSSLTKLLAANIAMAAILFASQLSLAVGGVLFVLAGPVAALVAAALICFAAGLTAAGLGWVHARKRWRLLAPWARPKVGWLTAIASAVSLLLTASAWIFLYGGGLDYGLTDISRWTAVSGASFIAGMFSVLPSGLGMREAVFVALGSSAQPNSVADAAMLAILTRLWLLAMDGLAILMGAAGLAIWRFGSRQ